MTNQMARPGPQNSRPYAEMEPGYETRPSFETRLAQLLKRTVKRQAQHLLRSALGGAGYAVRQRPAAHAPLRAGAADVRRILLVRVDLLGDTVLTTPAVRALRRAYPEATLDVLVQHSTAGVLEGDPDISHVLTYNPHIWRRPGAWVSGTAWREAITFLRQLRQPRYDVAISISGDIGSILTRLSGARRTFGYAREAYAHFLTDPLPGGRYGEHKHEVQYVLALAEAAGGIVLPEDAEPRLHVQPEERRKLAAALRTARARLGAHGPIITIHPGARNGRAKRWPLRQYADLADRCVRQLDALVVLTGSPNEVPLARAIMRQVHCPVLDLTGKTTLPELVGLLAASDVVVTGDSGPMHIACAVQTPVVALHGPTDPALSGPAAPDAVILRQRLWCSPCYDASATAECRFGNPICMKAIAPGAVLAAVRRQLRARQPDAWALRVLHGPEAPDSRDTHVPATSQR